MVRRFLMEVAGGVLFFAVVAFVLWLARRLLS